MKRRRHYLATPGSLPAHVRSTEVSRPRPAAWLAHVCEGDGVEIPTSRSCALLGPFVP